MRLFAGLDFDSELASELAGPGFGLPGARWVPKRNLHLTLCFMGEVPEDVAEEIHHQFRGITIDPFAITLSGFGLFGDRHRADTLWVGVERSDALERLATRIGAAAARAGARPGGKRFSPHVTLARLKGAEPARIQAFLDATPPFHAEAVPVVDFCLFESRLHRDGPEYRILERYGRA